VLIVGASVAVALSATGTPHGTAPKHLTKLQKEVLASRRDAVAWIARYVSHSTRVACDSTLCTALKNTGFPGSDLTGLRLGSRAPLTSALVVETPSVTTWLGTSFITDSAPLILASFGNKASGIDIRVVAPEGAAAYQRQLTAEMTASSKNLAPALLSGQGNVTVSIPRAAQAQMTKGEVDWRALVALFYLAGYKAVQVLDFGNTASGGSAGLPLRYMDLAVNGHIAHMSATAYMAWLLRTLRGLQYPAQSQVTVELDGTPALRVDFGAPTPLDVKS